MLEREDGGLGRQISLRSKYRVGPCLVPEYMEHQVRIPTSYLLYLYLGTYLLPTAKGLTRTCKADPARVQPRLHPGTHLVRTLSRRPTIKDI